MYIIAEAGVNHNGSEKLALELIEEASRAGADAVKFQTFNADTLVRKGTASADYQQIDGNTDQYELLKALELPLSSYHRLLNHSRSLGIEFLSTPFDLPSAQFLVELGMRRIKVPSGELTNTPFIEELAKYDLPLIISTGMATVDEIEDALDAVTKGREACGLSGPLKNVVTLLHCTSNYPAADNTVNLNAIISMKKQFCVPVGYSDHTDGVVVSTAAVALGAQILEKHFTLDRNMSGPDHRASIEPGELARLVEESRRIENCLGDGVKRPMESELPIRGLVRRSLVISRPISAGAVLRRADLELLRPGTGIAPKHLDSVIGSTLTISKKAGDFLGWDDLC